MEQQSKHRPGVIREAKRIVSIAIDSLTDRGLDELLSGYENDYNKLVEGLVEHAAGLLTNIKTVSGSEGHVPSLDYVDEAFEEAMRCESMGYFINSVFPDVDLEWFHVEWADMASRNYSIAIQASRDHGKSFFWSGLYPCWNIYRYKGSVTERRNNKNEGKIFSATSQFAKKLLGDLKGMIEENEIMRDRALPRTHFGWSTEEINTHNGVKVTVQGFKNATRGPHPGWIVVDDPQREEVLYSPAERDKLDHTLVSVVLPMSPPTGTIAVIGTPLHQNDLFAYFKDRDRRKSWIFREYPAIFPDGRLLYPSRYNADRLKAIKEERGPVPFAREYMLKPVVDDTSLFPYKLLNTAITGIDMRQYKLVNNIEAFPVEFEKTIVGCDFAKSANVGSDATVFTVWGLDKQNNFWLVYGWRKVGASFQEQIGKLKSIYHNFQPDVMVLESNNFQSIYTEYLEDSGMPIFPHNTGTGKHDFDNGVPGMQVLFNNEKVRIPYGNEESRKFADLLCSELNSITKTDKGFQSVGAHDDCVMSMWLARRGVQIAEEGGFDFVM